MAIYIKLLLAAVFWGGTFVAGRILAGYVSAYSAASIRFAIASTILLISIRLILGKLPKLNTRQFAGIVCLGLTGVFAYNILFFKGLQTITAGRAALLIAMNPIAIGFFSALFFKERITPKKASGILLSVLGAIVAITYGDIARLFRDSLKQEDLLILGCVASWVVYSLVGKLILKQVSPLVSVGYASLTGTLFLFLATLAKGRWDPIATIPLLGWCALAYLGVFGTVLAFLWYYEGILKIGPARTGVFINFVPVSAILLAYLILDEPITLSLAVGTALVVSGTFLVNHSKKEG